MSGSFNNIYRRLLPRLAVITALMMGTTSIATANSPKKAPKSSSDEFQAVLKALALPDLRKNASGSRGYKQVILSLVVVTDDEDKWNTICEKALKYRDAILTEFHETPIALSKGGGFADQNATLSRITAGIKKPLAAKW